MSAKVSHASFDRNKSRVLVGVNYLKSHDCQSFFVDIPRKNLRKKRKQIRVFFDEIITPKITGSRKCERELAERCKNFLEGVSYI